MTKTASGLKMNWSASKEDDVSTSCSAILFGDRRLSQIIRKMNDEDEAEDGSSSQSEGGSQSLEGGGGHEKSDSTEIKALNEVKRSMKFPKKMGASSLVESEVISVGNDLKGLEESVVIKSSYKPKLYRNRARQRSKRNNF